MYDQSHLDAYATALTENYKSWSGHGADHIFNDLKYSVSFETGKKYIRVVRDIYGQRSVLAFIEITTGDIYKAASWKAPAKNARGNLVYLTPNVVQWTGAT